jgi:hypothetical protein
MRMKRTPKAELEVAASDSWLDGWRALKTDPVSRRECRRMEDSSRTPQRCENTECIRVT